MNDSRWTVCGLWAALIWMWAAAAASAQQPTGGEKPATEPARASAPASDGEGVPAEKWIFVPYARLQEVLGREGGGGLVPLARYSELLQKFQALASQGARRIEAVLAEASYRGKVEQDLARLTATYKVRVLKEGGGVLPLKLGRAAVSAVRCPDPAVVLQATGEGNYALHFPKAGDVSLELDLEVPVQITPDGRELAFDTPPAAVSVVEMTIPGADQAVQVNAGATAVDAQSDADTTKWKAALGAGTQLVARWQSKRGTAPAMGVLTAVQNQLDVRIADGLVQSHAKLQFRVLRGTVDRLQVLIPKGARLVDVLAPGLKNWSVDEQPNAQQVTVELQGNEAKSIPVEILTESSLPTEGFPLAGMGEENLAWGIHAVGQTRESGVVSVSSTPDLSLAIEQQRGLVRIDGRELPADLQRPDVLAWRYFNPGFELKLLAEPVEPRLLAERETRVLLREDEFETTEELRLKVERSGLFELRLGLPPGYRVERVVCEAMKSYAVAEEATELRVTLNQKTLGDILLTITGRRPVARDESPRVVPLLKVVGAARDGGGLWLYAPESLELVAVDAEQEGLLPRPREGAANVPGLRLASGWTFKSPPEISVQAERRKARLTAAIATAVRVRQEVVEVETRLDYNVQFSGLDTFRFAVPEAAVEGMQVTVGPGTAVGILQQSRDGDAADSLVPWKVVLQRETVGPVELRIRYDLKPERQGALKQARFRVTPVRALETPAVPPRTSPTSVTAVAGEMVVSRDRALSVAGLASDDCEAIDVRELRQLPQEGDVAFRYFAQPEPGAEGLSLQVSAEQLQLQEVVDTVVSKAALEAVVTEDSQVIYRARFRLRSSERQRLTLDLPRDSVPLEALVAGKRVELERAGAEVADKRWDPYRISVTRTGTAEEPFVLAVVFQTPYNPRPLPGRGGNLALQLPRLRGGGEEAGVVVVQELRTTVWIPPAYQLVSRPGDFTSDTPPRWDWWRGTNPARPNVPLEQWFEDSAGGALFAFQAAGDPYTYSRLGSADTLEVGYWKGQFVTWVLSGAVFLAGMLLSRTSWTNRLTVVLLLAFLLAVWALGSPEFVLNLLAACRFGLLAALAWWVIRTGWRWRWPLDRLPPQVPPVRPSGPSSSSLGNLSAGSPAVATLFDPQSQGDEPLSGPGSPAPSPV